MRSLIIFLTTIAFVLCACSDEVQLQSVAGYIKEGSNEQQIIVDSMGSGVLKYFALSDQTTFDAEGLVAGNIAEVIYTPTTTEIVPTAITITTDDTYRKVLGRWTTLENERLPIDIKILQHGKIEQTSPSGILQLTAWQLTAKEDTIRLIGRLSLPPIVEKDSNKKKTTSEKKTPSEKGDSITPPARREQAFTTLAALDRDGDRRTLTIITDKGTKSTLYQAPEVE